MKSTGKNETSNIFHNRLVILAFITVAIIIPIMVSMDCDGTSPTGPETTSDTCNISYVVLDPEDVTVTIADERVVFTAEAYDSEDRLLDPAPTFTFECSTREVTITPNGNRVYANPWTITTAPARITVSVRDCEGRQYTDSSTMTVNDSPAWLFLKLFI